MATLERMARSQAPVGRRSLRPVRPVARAPQAEARDEVPRRQGRGEGTADRPGSGERTPREQGTRERILEVALDLFVEQGYDKTSLREIAERMGFTKAALYYHFASKSDLLAALHLRLHALMEETVRDLGEPPVTMGRWEAFLDRAVAGLEANRKLFVLHQRNQSAFEQLHIEGHGGQHQEMEARLRAFITDPALPAEQRIRMAMSLGAAFVIAMLPAEVFAGVDDEGVTATLRRILGDILHSRRR